MELCPFCGKELVSEEHARSECEKRAEQVTADLAETLGMYNEGSITAAEFLNSAAGWIDELRGK